MLLEHPCDQLFSFPILLVKVTECLSLALHCRFQLQYLLREYVGLLNGDMAEVFVFSIDYVAIAPFVLTG